MKPTPRQYAELLYEITHDVKKTELEARIQGFVRLLVSTRVLVLVPRILQAFDQVWNEHLGVVGLKITTARKSSPVIQTAIQKTFHGLKVEMDEVVDARLIGGMKLQMNDTVIDGSVKEHLNHLRKQLINA